MATLNVESREGTGKYVAFNMRKEGFIPGVVYGNDLEKNINVKVPLKEFMHLIHSGERMVDLKVGGQSYQTVIKEVQHGTFASEINHVDFRAVSATDKLHVSVEIEFEGESEGQKAGGVIEQSQFHVDIECVPTDLPESIVLDISGMKVGDVLYVSDLPAVKGVKYRTHGDIAVASCHMPAGEEESEAEAESEPEVIGEKKKEA